jgi:hypothetical protein
MALGHEINILDLVEAYIPVQEGECIQDRVVELTLAPAEVCIQDLGEECTLVQEVGCTLVREVAFILGLVAGFTRVPAEDCTLVLVVASIVAPAGECIRGPAVSHIEAIYHLGQYSLSISRNMG